MRQASFRRSLPALGAALAAGLLYAFVASAHPLWALAAFAGGPFSSVYALSSLLSAAAPLLVASLGAAVAFRAGRFNLGGEGQAAVGAFSAALVLRAATGPEGEALLPPLGAIPLALLAAAAAGAALSLLSALAELLTGAEVLLTSFLLGQAASISVDWAVAGPLRDASSNLLAMSAHATAFRLPRLAPPSSLDLGALLALLLALLMSWLLLASRPGYELRMGGENPRFARAMGFPTSLELWPLGLSGALHGLAGALIVLGSLGRGMKSMTGGLGWNGLAVSLLAATNPLAAIPASLFFAFLDSGARSASLLADLSPDSSAVMKAIVLLLVTMRLPGRKKPR
jgi:simple sugar transport system permease protein